MVVHSASPSVGNEEPKSESLIDSVGSEESSVDLENSSIRGTEHSEVEDILRVISDNIRKTDEERSHVILNLSSSNDSYESDYTRESDLDLSIMYADSDEGFEGVLQMGCMDALFLPPNKNVESRKSLFKLNKKGKKELNIELKGPLALGLEAKMKNKAEKTKIKVAKSFGSVLQETMSCGTHGGRNGIIEDEKLQYYEPRDPDFETFRSLMSLSHGSSQEEDCDNSVIPENFMLPPPPQLQSQRQPPHMQLNSMHHLRQNQGHGRTPPYHYHLNQQQQRQSHDLNMNGFVPNENFHSFNGIQNNREFPTKLHGMALQSPLSISSMPNQKFVGEQSAFEERSYFSYDVNTAPDPPSKSLPRIVEDDIPEPSSEDGSDSSMVACGSIISDTPDKPILDTAKPVTLKNGGKLSKVDRWKKANIQRLKKKQHIVNSTVPIPEEKGVEDYSIGSDQATYSSAHENKKVATEKDDQSLAFDSIFTRRIEKRRVSKLKKSGGNENMPDLKSVETTREKPQTDASAVLETPVATSELQRSDNSIKRIDSASSDGIPEPQTQTIDYRCRDLYDPSAIEAVAAAAALALKKEYKPKKQPNFDQEDTENLEPPAPIVKGKESAVDQTQIMGEKELNLLGRDTGLCSKNPFQDEDIFEVKEESDADPLLTKSSSDHEDILRPSIYASSRKEIPLSPLQTARISSSPLACRNRTIPMTPSPRHSSRPIASPGNYHKWNSSMQSLSSRMASVKINRCSSGEVKRTESIKCFDSVDTSEFFEANMYIN